MVFVGSAMIKVSVSIMMAVPSLTGELPLMKMDVQL